MQNRYSLRRRGGEWNILLLGVVCALLAAASSSSASADISQARYMAALVALQQCGTSTTPVSAEMLTPQVWRKHLPYVMTALHHMATAGGHYLLASLVRNQLLSALHDNSFHTKSHPSIPLFAIHHNGISTTHFLC